MSTSFVLLCAEEDDLELVQWVHAARARGLAPEVVIGVEADDAPLLDALADTGCGLFVILRSESLGSGRMREIKAAFARHRAPTQRLFALRVDYGAALAIDRIVAELGETRPRSEVSMTISLDDLTGPQPTVRAAIVEGPSVEGALRMAERVAQHDVTERFEIGDETIPMTVAPAMAVRTEPNRGGWQRTAAWIAGLGVVAAASTAAVLVGPNLLSDARMPPAAASVDADDGPEAVAPAGIVDAAIDDDESVVIRVGTGKPAPIERTAAPTRRRSRAPSERAAAPPVALAAPEPAMTADGLPVEPAPLDPAPPAPEPIAQP